MFPNTTRKGKKFNVIVFMCMSMFVIVAVNDDVNLATASRRLMIVVVVVLCLCGVVEAILPAGELLQWPGAIS